MAAFDDAFDVTRVTEYDPETTFPLFRAFSSAIPKESLSYGAVAICAIRGESHPELPCSMM